MPVDDVIFTGGVISNGRFVHVDGVCSKFSYIPYSVPNIFSHKITGYFQILSRSKKLLSVILCGQFWHQKADTKGILKSQENKTWKKNVLI